jgi:hypothetical protein
MKKIVLTILFSVALFSSSLVFAKMINLYEQPQADSKVVATVDSNAGIVPIYSPPKSEWIKVGDPHNGNVGWMKSSEFNTSGSGFSFRVINSGSGPNSFQVLQFGTPNAEQSKAALKEMEAKEKALQKQMQDMVKTMFNSQQNTNWPNFPVIIPVIINPQETATPPSTKPAEKPTTTKQ